MSDIPIQGMDFKQLRNEVQLLRDELAIMQRKYEDILYNLDDDNFGTTLKREKDNMKASIEVAEDGITLLVSEVYPDGTENDSSIKQTADAISSEVTSRQSADGILQSNITQTATSITSQIKRTFSGGIATYTNSIEPYYPSSGADKSKMHQNLHFTGTTKRYYFWNDVLEEWDYVKTPSISSLFEQTASGFKLRGDVSIIGNLITNGNIEGGTIKGAELKTTTKIDVGTDASIGNKLSFKDSTGTAVASIRIYEGTSPYLSILATGSRPIMIDSDGNVEIDSGDEVIIRGEYVKLGTYSGGTNNILMNGYPVATQKYVNDEMEAHIAAYH